MAYEQTQNGEHSFLYQGSIIRYRCRLSAALACASPEFSRRERVSYMSYTFQCQTPRFYWETSHVPPMLFSDAFQQRLRLLPMSKRLGKGMDPVHRRRRCPRRANGGVRGRGRGELRALGSFDFGDHGGSDVREIPSARG